MAPAYKTHADKFVYCWRRNAHCTQHTAHEVSFCLDFDIPIWALWFVFLWMQIVMKFWEKKLICILFFSIFYFQIKQIVQIVSVIVIIQFSLGVRFYINVKYNCVRSEIWFLNECKKDFHCLFLEFCHF